MQNVKKRGSAKARQKATRLISAQAVYQMLLNEQSPQQVVREFLDYRIAQTVDGFDLVTAEPERLSKMVQGIEQDKERLLALLQGAVEGKTREFAQMELLLQSILLLGAYELVHHNDIDAAVIINDYIEVARAYYEDDQAKLVNGVLDKVSKTVR